MLEYVHVHVYIGCRQIYIDTLKRISFTNWKKNIDATCCFIMSISLYPWNCDSSLYICNAALKEIMHSKKLKETNPMLQVNAYEWNSP